MPRIEKMKTGVFVDVFVVIIGAILVVTGYLVMVLMTAVQQDTVSRSILMLSLLAIVSSMIQLASLAMLGKIRENLRGAKR
ncbi:MAG: hypothetical protein V1836_01350 [Candidatus Aenigmatarchaeota archaeon]